MLMTLQFNQNIISFSFQHYLPQVIELFVVHLYLILLSYFNSHWLLDAYLIETSHVLQTSLRFF